MIKYNGKDIIPRFNGKDISRVMFNGKQIYPSNKGIDPATAPNGVYVYSNDGLLYNPDDWDTANNDNAVGVAVIDNNCKFAITKGEKPQRAWSAALYGIDVSGLTNYSDSSQAATDFNGESNTAFIRAATPSEDASNNAAHYCYNQTISIDGRGTVHGYLPALGELQAARNNISLIDSAMSLIGGIVMAGDYTLWSSTEYSSNYVWISPWGRSSIIYKGKSSPNSEVVPVFPLT